MSLLFFLSWERFTIWNRFYSLLIFFIFLLIFRDTDYRRHTSIQTHHNTAGKEVPHKLLLHNEEEPDDDFQVSRRHVGHTCQRTHALTFPYDLYTLSWGNRNIRETNLDSICFFRELPLRLPVLLLNTEHTVLPGDSVWWSLVLRTIRLDPGSSRMIIGIQCHIWNHSFQ